MALTLSATVLGATPANAATGAALPFDTFFRLVVDPDHGLEFVSGGPSTDSLAVFDADGLLVTTLPMEGPSGMALVGSTLFVAESDAPDIAMVDTSTVPPTLIDTLEVGSFTELGDLTYVRGRLWFFTANGLASVRPDGTGLSGPFDIVYSPTRFADGLSGGDELIMFDGNGSPLRRYTATLPPRLELSAWSASGYADQMAIVPGRATLVASWGASYSFSEVRLADGATLRAYAAAPYPTATAITTAHGGMIAGGSNGIYNPDIWAYRIGQTTSFFEHDFGSTEQTVVRGGIAWSADGDRIFAITVGTPSPTFEVITPTGLPTAEWPTLEVTPSASRVEFGDPIDVVVHLEGGTTNRFVKLFAHPTAGMRALIGSGTVDASGNLAVTAYVPPATTILTASYAGDADWGRASTAATVRVISRTGLKLRNDIGQRGACSLYPRGSTIPLRANVRPKLDGGEATIIVQVNDGDGWRPKATFSAPPYDAIGTFVTNIPRYVAGPAYRARVHSEHTPSYLASTSTWHCYRYET